MNFPKIRNLKKLQIQKKKKNISKKKDFTNVDIERKSKED